MGGTLPIEAKAAGGQTVVSGQHPRPGCFQSSGWSATASLFVVSKICSGLGPELHHVILDLRIAINKLGVEVHSYFPITWELEAEKKGHQFLLHSSLSVGVHKSPV